MAASVTPDYFSPGLIAWRRRTDTPLLVIAIATLPFLLLDLARHHLSLSDRRFLDAVNLFVLVVFLVDYVVEVVLTSNRRSYVRHEWASLLIVIAQAVAVIPALAGFGALRLLRGGRAVRAAAAMMRMLAVGGASAKEGRTILRRKAGTFALSLAGLTWLTGAACFALAEGVGPGERVPSIFDALWWSAMTITTIGYGDIAPVTAAGRVTAVVTAVVGIASFAILTAKLAEFLVRPDVASAGRPAARPTILGPVPTPVLPPAPAAPRPIAATTRNRVVVTRTRRVDPAVAD